MVKQKKRKRGKTPNGDIDLSAKFSMALRWFAGGEPIDIMQTHGVGYYEVYISVWNVVDAINSCPLLKIEFSNHKKQKEIVAGFKKKSWVDFDNCMGCIDGMLVWTNKPNKQTLRDCDIGKFLCGRKNKFGLNLQAVCDQMRRFIAINVGFPGSTSDFLSFVNSYICRKLNDEGSLVPGMCFYGDTAYASNETMAVPYKGAQWGPKDAYNFYHSQIRINIECAFGMLVHRWGVLRKPIPVNISIDKTTHLVRALCILHNFCINQKEPAVPSPSQKDVANIASESGDTTASRRTSSRSVVGGGPHSNDLGVRSEKRAYECNDKDTALPRTVPLRLLIKQGKIKRPKPMGSTTTNK